MTSRQCARRGVRLGWTGGVNRRSVSELTLAFAIALLHRVPETSGALRAGEWSKLVGRQLTGRTFGIIGCGFVGQDLVRLLAPFDCRVLAHDIRDYPEFYRDHRVTPVALPQLLAESDIVSLHVPLDRSTRGMIGAAQIAAMRTGTIIINAARGGLIDEDALAQALDKWPPGWSGVRRVSAGTGREPETARAAGVPGHAAHRRRDAGGAAGHGASGHRGTRDRAEFPATAGRVSRPTGEQANRRIGRIQRCEF